jgi:beta-ureidopropionase / N-carbamoyl-L-amino-acid hydrolase
VSCVGSRLAAGVLDPDTARALRDADGVTLGEAMARAGHDPAALGPDPDRLAGLAAFVELHVEQGRGLVEYASPVGVASAIWPHGRWRFDLEGAADHAGTTRLEDRRDPMPVLAHLVLAARHAAAACGALATVGRVQVEPNGTNAVPAAVRAWLDARAEAEGTVDALVKAVREAALGAASEQGVTVSLRRESWTPRVTFDERLRDRMAGLLGPLLARHGADGVPVLPTGAGHDAGILAAAVPAGMLFVRNPTGISHSPQEYADEADCLAGVEALAAVLADLAG